MKPDESLVSDLFGYIFFLLGVHLYEGHAIVPCLYGAVEDISFQELFLLDSRPLFFQVFFSFTRRDEYVVFRQGRTAKTCLRLERRV